ncbi:MAG: Gfo/Idh/MocA family oxidoreductase [Rubricoccaceae bacterium]
MSSFTFTEVVRLAQIGVSGWGRNLLRNLAALPSAELVVFCDTDDTALSAASSVAPKARSTSRIETVLADSSVDAVVLAPSARSTSIAADCLEAGKHVFIEAPLADTSDAASHLIALASSKDLRLMTGHVLRYHPAIRHLQQHITDGALGTIRTLSWHLAELGTASDVSVLDHLGPSALSVTQALVQEAPRAVTAHGQRYTSDGLEDVVLLTIEFSNGTLAHLHLSRTEARKARTLTVAGSKGLAVFDDMAPTEPLRLVSRSDTVENRTPTDYAQTVRARWGDVHIPRLSTVEPLALECREFIAAVREQRAPLTDGADGLATLRLMEAAKQSLNTSAVRIELA